MRSTTRCSQGKPPCEVTPDSVFLDPRLGAMVGDLGVARARRSATPAADNDPHAAWVAPEVLRGEDAHPRSAVYSFGAIAYTLLTGGPPHAGDAMQIAQARRRRGISEVRPDLPATLDTVFAVAMAPRPAQALRDRRRGTPSAEPRHLRRAERAGAGGVAALPPRSSAPKTGGARPPRRSPASVPPSRTNPRRGRALVGLLVGGALAAGAVAGTVAAGGDSTAPAPHHGDRRGR